MTYNFKELFLNNHSPKQTMIKNLFWLAMTQGSRVFRLLIVIYAARLLGTAEYGLLSYALALLGMLSLFADIGISDLLTRDIAAQKDQRPDYFAAAFWLKILLIVLTGLAIFLIGPHLTRIEAVQPLIYLAILLMAFDNMRDLILAYLRGTERMELETLIVMIMNLAMAGFGLIILLWAPNAKNLLTVYVLSSAASLLAAAVISRKIFRGIFRNFKKALAMEILWNCWPIAVSIGFSAMFGLDIIMLGWWRTAPEIGWYSAGQRMVQILYVFPTLIMTAIFPALSAIIKNRDQYKEKLINETSMVLVFCFTLPVIAAGIVLSRPIFQLVFGEQYLPGVPAFQVLLINLGFIFPGMILNSLVLAHNQQKKIMKYAVGASLANIILCIVLIPKFGIVGAALAALAAQALNYSLILHEIKKISHFETLPKLKKVAFASVAAGLLSFGLNQAGTPVLATLIVAAGAYAGILFLLKEAILSESIQTFRSFNHDDL